MTIARRRFLHLTAAAAALPFAARAARAETWPSRPVHIISGFPPGGPAGFRRWPPSSRARPAGTCR